MNNILFLTAFCLCVASVSAKAQNVSSPSVKKGVWGFNNAATYAVDDKDDADAFKQKTRMSYGVTDKLAFSIAGEVKKNEGESTDYDETELRLIYKLTDDGAPINAAIRVPYDINHNGDSDTIGAELLLGQKFVKWRHIFNIDTQHDIGEKSKGGLELDLAWGSYFQFDKFRLGGEYYVDFGKLKDNQRYSSQEHQVGPTVKFKAGRLLDTDIKLEFAYFRGISRSADDNVFKNEIEFEF